MEGGSKRSQHSRSSLCSSERTCWAALILCSVAAATAKSGSESPPPASPTGPYLTHAAGVFHRPNMILVEQRPNASAGDAFLDTNAAQPSPAFMRSMSVISVHQLCQGAIYDVEALACPLPRSWMLRLGLRCCLCVIGRKWHIAMSRFALPAVTCSCSPHRSAPVRLPGRATDEVGSNSVGGDSV